MFLIIMGAHLKWMEVHVTNKLSSSATVELLCKMFAMLGLPELSISDNATAFMSMEFTEYIPANPTCPNTAVSSSIQQST